MTSYDNGHGMRITHIEKVIKIEIYKNSSLYTPFICLRNIGATSELSKESTTSNSNSDNGEIKIDIDDKEKTPIIGTESPVNLLKLLSTNIDVYYTHKNRATSLTFIAQSCPKLSLSKQIARDVHTINPLELMTIAYTLPAFVVKEILSHIRALKSNISLSGAPVLTGTVPSEIFGAVVAQYISLRDGLYKGDHVVVEGTCDVVLWDGGKFCSLNAQKTST